MKIQYHVLAQLIVYIISALTVGLFGHHIIQNYTKHIYDWEMFYLALAISVFIVVLLLRCIVPEILVEAKGEGNLNWQVAPKEGEKNMLISLILSLVFFSLIWDALLLLNQRRSEWPRNLRRIGVSSLSKSVK